MMLGHKVKTIKELPEAEALKSGADLMGETFIFSVAVGLLMLEVARQNRSANRSNEAKEKKKREKIEQLNAHFHELEARIEVLEREQQNLRVMVGVTQQNNQKSEKIDQASIWNVFSYFPGNTIERRNSA